ncbi:histidine phosphatase family protein [Candidatus Kaiserbacteria bacterium]|nr:histidine phosphatase family protein [Candidatus Kaiserbacteria bacterium]
MDVYLVRHGETALNRAHRHQFPNTPLSEEGRRQAEEAGKRLTSCSHDLLIASTYTRAAETACIIGTHLSLTPEPQDIFHEIRRSTSLRGKSHFHPKTFWYVLNMLLRRRNSTWHLEDAENFADILKRGEAARIYLEELAESHTSVVVVSHAVFIQLFIPLLVHKDVRTWKELIPALLHVGTMNNGDAVHLDFDVTTGVWRVLER